MLISTFRRNVVKTLTPKATKLALRTVSKNTSRMQIVQAAVALKRHTGQLLQTMGQYLLGAQQTQEMKADAAVDLGDLGYDLTILARALKVKLPSTTKKAKLVGTRGAGLLQLDSLATDILRLAEQALFACPKMTSVKKMVSMPQKGGVKEERSVDVVDLAAEQAAEMERQNQMRSFLSGAVDLYWRLCFDMTGNPPTFVLEAKLARLKAEYPTLTFDTGETSAPKASAKTTKPKAPKKAAKAAKAEPVPV